MKTPLPIYLPNLTTTPQLLWAHLRPHSIVYSLGFNQFEGAGIRLILIWLVKGLGQSQSAWEKGWQLEVQTLLEHIERLKLPSTISERERSKSVRLHRLDALRRTVPAVGVERAEILTRIFCSHVALCAASNRQISVDLIHGLTQMIKGRTHSVGLQNRKSDWLRLWPNLVSETQFTTPQLEGASNQILKFCSAFNSTLTAVTSPPQVSVTIQKIQAAMRTTAQVSAQPPYGLPDKPWKKEDSESISQAISLPTDPQDAEEPLSWREFLSSKSKFCLTGDRLGLDSWDTLPIEHTQTICRTLARDIASDNDQKGIEATLLIVSLIIGSDIDRVMGVSLNRSSDVSIDIKRGCLIYPKHLLLAEEVNPPTNQRELICVPLPKSVATKIRGWAKWGAAETIGELLHQVQGFRTGADIQEAAHRLLKQCGDSHLLAWPGKWAKSGAKIFMRCTKSDLLTSICSMSPQVSAPGALHYFHPSFEDIWNACSTTFNFLGLENPVPNDPVVELPSNSPKWLSGDTLTTSYAQLAEDFQTSCLICSQDTDPTELLVGYNQATRLCASLLVFMYGGRASKIDRLTFGSILGNDNLLHLHDKELDDDRGSRLVPKLPRVRNLIRLYLNAIQRFATQALEYVAHNDKKTWRELSRLQLRYDAPAFQLVRPELGVWRRYPMEASDIEMVSQQYFKQKKNFARHVLVTQWTQHSFDPNLLRVITGHAHDRLDFPSAISVYSPISAINAAAKPLEIIHNRWLGDTFSVAPRGSAVELLNMSIRRMQKNHAAVNTKRPMGETACRFDQWHFVATRAVVQIRSLLLNDTKELNFDAKLLLHLLVFDLIHDLRDLQKILENWDWEKCGRDAVLRWRRDGERVDCTLPIQLPTELMLRAHVTSPVTITYEKAAASAHTWLASIWNPGSKRTHSNVDDSLFEQLCTATQLWADLHIPGVLQLSFHPLSHAVQMDADSASKLLDVVTERAPGLNAPHTPDGVKLFPDSDRDMELVLAALNFAADGNRPWGGSKSRMRVYFERLAENQFVGGDSWPGVLDRCLRHNMHALTLGQSKAIEFSSMATYLSNLRVHLLSQPEHLPSEMRELDYLELAAQLKQYKHAAGDKLTNESRAEQQSSAALWLLRTMREIGLPIPTAVLEGRAREMLPQHANAVVHISNVHLESTWTIFRHHPFRSDLNRLRAELALMLFSTLPLRAQELTTLRAQDISTLGESLILRESAFSHIKSEQSWRYLHLTPPVAEKIQKLQQRVMLSLAPDCNDNYLFLERRGEKLTLHSASWLLNWVTSTLSRQADNPRFRIHALRARTACAMAFPGWEEKLDKWRKGDTGPSHLATNFSYSTENAWRLDQTRVALGHAHTTTTTLYYLYNCMMVRAMAAAGTLTQWQPTELLCHHLEVTIHALRKAGQRNPDIGRDPWIFLAPKRVQAKRPISPSADPIDEPVAGVPIHSDAPHKQCVRYLALRLLDVSQTESTDRCRLTHSQSRKTESIFEKFGAMPGTLARARQRGSSEGRAKTADIKLLEEDAFERLYPIWSCLDASARRDLNDFLAGTGNGSTWLDRLPGVLTSAIEPCGLRATVIVGRRHSDSQLLVRLGQLPAVDSADTVRDQAQHARIFLYPFDSKPSLVFKSRYLSVSRIVLAALSVEIDA